MDPLTELDKATLIELLCARVRADLEAVRASQAATQAGATHSESRAENAKDTRATESSYLARGLADRVEELESDLAKLEALPRTEFDPDAAVALAALVTLEDDDGELSHYLLVPAGGGESLELDGTVVRALTVQSPLGSRLVGRCEGDDVAATLPRGPFSATISGVR